MSSGCIRAVIGRYAERGKGLRKEEGTEMTFGPARPEAYMVGRESFFGGLVD